MVPDGGDCRATAQGSGVAVGATVAVAVAVGGAAVAVALATGGDPHAPVVAIARARQVIRRM
jgi:hypothetical protein